MKLLITGGAGFIGSNFIRHWFKSHSDDQIVNFDKLTYAGRLENLDTVKDNPNYGFVKGDICDPKIVEPLAKRADAIVNFAAETHVDRSIMDPQAFVRTDVLGTQVLLECVRKFGIKKYVQVSTDEVYGSIEQGSFKEESPLNPTSPYSASKAAGDFLCLAYYKTYGLPIVITRGANTFGPNQYPEKLMPLFITNLLEGKKVPVYGDGKQIRNWIYVLDHCRGILSALTKGEPGQVYNIGGNAEKTNLEITQMILEILGKDETMIEYVKDRPAHDFRYSLDSFKLSLLGWQPIFSFKEALKNTISWYSHNDWWWKPVKSGQFLEYYKKQYGSSEPS